MTTPFDRPSGAAILATQARPIIATHTVRGDPAEGDLRMKALRTSVLMTAIFLAWRAIVGVPAAAQDVEAGGLLLTGAWIKAAEQDRDLSYAFVTVRNRGQEPDRLVAAFSPVAAAVEIRMPDPSVADGARTMTEGLTIPAAGVVALEPNGLHLFLRGIQQPLGVGDAIRIVLRFERAGPVTLQLRAHYH